MLERSFGAGGAKSWPSLGQAAPWRISRDKQWTKPVTRADRPSAVATANPFTTRVSAAYREQTSPAQVALGADVLEELYDHLGSGSGDENAPGTIPHRYAVVVTGPSDTFRLRRYGSRAMELSKLLPLLESFGLVVVEAVPHPIHESSDRPAAHIDDIGLRSFAGPLDMVAGGGRLVAAIEAATTGQADVDSLNRLVLAARLDWHDVALLRAYRRYRRQTGVRLTDSQLDDPLVAWPGIARHLIGYAAARFATLAVEEDRPGAVESAKAVVLDGLDHVSLLEEHQVLRGYLALIDATLRTNWAIGRDKGNVAPIDRDQTRQRRRPRSAPADAEDRDVGPRPNGRGHPPAQRLDS
jgi:NAD-specific glutamate dehydrogenase